MTWVAGADGCPAGWLVVFRSINGEPARARIFKNIADALNAPEQPKIVAIDIPIGLQRTSQKGGRSADREARKVLRLRKSSIFPVPSRAALGAESFRAAQSLEFKNSVPPKKLGKQAFNLFKKIRQVDSLMPKLSAVIFECHPEVSFWAMNQKCEMTLSKRSRKGFDERCKILSRNGYESSFLTKRVGTSEECNRDDFPDACVAAWTAERIHMVTAFRFPNERILDDRDIEMAIWA